MTSLIGEGWGGQDEAQTDAGVITPEDVLLDVTPTVGSGRPVTPAVPTYYLPPPQSPPTPENPH